MNKNFDYKITALGHARVYTFYMLNIFDGNNSEKVSVPTSLVGDTQLNGRKPAGIPDFIHIKTCLIFGTRLNEILDDSMKTRIFKSKEKDIEVGNLNIPSKGDFTLFIDNESEIIYLISNQQ